MVGFMSITGTTVELGAELEICVELDCVAFDTDVEAWVMFADAVAFGRGAWVCLAGDCVTRLAFCGGGTGWAPLAGTVVAFALAWVAF